MTDREWFTSADPTAMLRHVADHISDRKLRLYAAGCCRRLWHRFADLSLRRAVMDGERFADGQRTAAQLEPVRRPVYLLHGDDSTVSHLAAAAMIPAAPAAEFVQWRQNVRTGRQLYPEYEGRLEALNTLAGVLAARADGGGEPRRDVVVAQERSAQADLLRCVVGDPFTVTVPDPRWQTDTVLGIARRVYDRRDFAALPILADALEEAGCDDAELLHHCRHGREHARGCWAVDLLLGKE